MALNKNSIESDGIVDLYRAALYLARESKETGLAFIKKAQKKLGKKLSIDLQMLKKGNAFKNHFDYTFWAEKVLDEYKRLK